MKMRPAACKHASGGKQAMGLRVAVPSGIYLVLVVLSQGEHRASMKS